MLKPSITIGRDAENKLHVLYLGDDAEKAMQAIRNLPEGIVEAEVYRKPRHFKRVQVTEPTANELPTVQNPEPDPENANVQGEQSPLEQLEQTPSPVPASVKLGESEKPKAPKAEKAEKPKASKAGK